MPRTYTVTIQNVVTKARYLTNDNAATYRISDAEYIGWLNDAIVATVIAVPQMFLVQGTHTCTAGAFQQCINSRMHSLVEVVGVPVADFVALTAFSPTWQTTTAAATAKNWLRPLGEPLSFYVYPPSTIGQALTINYVELPAKLTVVTDFVPLPENYEPILLRYLVAMAELGDDEHVNSGRAAQTMAEFVAAVKGG